MFKFSFFLHTSLPLSWKPGSFLPLHSLLLYRGSGLTRCIQRLNDLNVWQALWNSNVNEKPGKAVTSQWPAYIHLLYLSTICEGHFWWWALQLLSESLITAAATRICTLRINFQVIVHFLQWVSVQFVAIKFNFFTLFCFLKGEKLHTGYWLSRINYLLSDITCTFSCQVLWSWSVVVQTLGCSTHWLIKVLGIEILILKILNCYSIIK